MTSNNGDAQVSQPAESEIITDFGMPFIQNVIEEKEYKLALSVRKPRKSTYAAALSEQIQQEIEKPLANWFAFLLITF